MTEVPQPDWLKGYEPAPAKRGNPAWVKNGPSPNPAGRPKGLTDRRLKLTQALADDAHEVTKVVLEAAKAGDLQACSLILARVCPPLKANSERVQFELDPALSLTAQAQQVLVAVSEGRLDPDTGKSLIGCIQTLSGLKSVEDLEARLSALEEKASTA